MRLRVGAPPKLPKIPLQLSLGKYLNQCGHNIRGPAAHKQVFLLQQPSGGTRTKLQVSLNRRERIVFKARRCDLQLRELKTELLRNLWEFLRGRMNSLSQIVSQQLFLRLGKACQ